MPEFEARFETPFESDEFNHRGNIEGYFEKKIESIKFAKKITAIAFEMKGDKAEGYTLEATVSYRDDKELYPPFFEIPIRWKAIFDKEEWLTRFRRESSRIT